MFVIFFQPPNKQIKVRQAAICENGVGSHTPFFFDFGD